MLYPGRSAPVSAFRPHWSAVLSARYWIKKPGLDTTDMDNFRPITNLSTASKILEKLLPKISSGYRPLSRVHERYRQTTDGRAIAYSERERECSLKIDIYGAREGTYM